jgi:hypothetical protein
MGYCGETNVLPFAAKNSITAASKSIPYLPI